MPDGMPNKLNAESESVNSILNDDNLSISQKRILLEEMMANLPEEQRKELEGLKQMSDLDWAATALTPALSRALSVRNLKHIIKENTPKPVIHSIKKVKEHLDKAIPNAFNNIYAAKIAAIGSVLKSDVLQTLGKESVKRGSNAVEHEAKDKAKTIEYEAYKMLMPPKIPYVDY